MAGSAATAIATIDSFIAQVGLGMSKRAAEANTEPGSIGGETEHPVKDVDDRTQEPPEGERTAENSKDVKEDQGAASVEGKPEAKAASDAIYAHLASFAIGGTQKRAEGGAVQTAGSATDDQNQTGTKKTPTGEDPAHETNSAKAKKEDKEQGGRGGTSHPASTENDEIDGHKWAADMSLEKAAGAMKALAETICAQLTVPSDGRQKHASAAQSGTLAPNTALQAGWELAGLVNGSMDKQAADAMVRDTIAGIVKGAQDRADDTARFLNQFFAAEKTGGEEEEAMMPAGPGAPPGGGPPPGGGGSEEDMLAALGGAEAGGDPGGGMGGDPGGGMGGAPGGAMGGEPAGGGEQAAMLAQLLEQLGVTPEELEAAMAEEGGGGAPPGGLPPGGPPMGGAPPGGGGPPPGMEVAAGDRSGRMDAEKAAGVRQYITEIMKRSRAPRRS